MATSLVGFFLDRRSANDAIARLQTAGYSGHFEDGEQFDSKMQQGRSAVVVTAPGQEAEVRAVLLLAGAVDVQDDADGSDAQGRPA